MWINTPGITSDNVSYVVYDKNEGANKTPIIFSGNFLLNAGIGKWYDQKAYQILIFSFWKLLNMRGYSRIFPSTDNTIENVKFAHSQISSIKSAIPVPTLSKNPKPEVGYWISKERVINPFYLKSKSSSTSNM